MKNSLVFLFIGAPGSGKSTQGDLISKKYNIPHISTGNILRESIKEKDELGKKVEQYVNSGVLVPDEIITSVVEKRIKKQDCEKGFVIDGFPRNMDQVKEFNKMLDEYSFQLKQVLNIQLENKILIKRLSGRRICSQCKEQYNLYFNPSKQNKCEKCEADLIQRKDDNEEIVKQRLIVYEKETNPLIEYYEKEKILVNIDGNRDKEEIFEEILENKYDFIEK
ncbi:MAG: adenylate kinase [bacterium]